VSPFALLISDKVYSLELFGMKSIGNFMGGTLSFENYRLLDSRQDVSFSIKSASAFRRHIVDLKLVLAAGVNTL